VKHKTKISAACEGCVVEQERIVQSCPPCAAECAQVRARWLADYVARPPLAEKSGAR
jgi:hypothetical protein